jgi:predicted NBD/HSP70 family sugar kinase
VRKIDTRHFVRATRSTGRDINRQILLNLVRDQQPISRADLARRMDIGRGMVTSLVDELLNEGAIYEGGTIDAPRGRRPQMLYVRTRDRLVVGVDVRFSRTALMLADFAGNAIAQESFDTVVDPEGLVDLLATRIRRLCAAHAGTATCEGVGLVVPGMVDQRTGRVLNSPQLGWRDVEIRTLLADAVGLPVQIENAPVACAQAQLWLGQRGGTAGGGGRVPRDFVYMTVSDGVGVGVVVDGQVVRGSGFTAGEFGHVPLNLDGPRCLCGARGCLEAYTSNLATVSRYLGHELSPERTRPLLAASGLTIGDVIARARSGDARAAAAIDETARYLGAGIASVVNALNPAQVFVGGEITAAWDLVAPAVQAALAERALTTAAAATPIIAEPPEALPRLRGAAALVAAPVFAAPQVA